jgi:hypothetical protein
MSVRILIAGKKIAHTKVWYPGSLEKLLEAKSRIGGTPGAGASGGTDMNLGHYHTKYV